jgi:hypothetical protein
VEAHALHPTDGRLGLICPLKSRKTFNRSVIVNGNRTETQMTIEFVGSDGVKFVIDAIMCMTKTNQAIENILTTHTQIFASRRDMIPESADVRTLILQHINGIPESNCRRVRLFTTIVDESGVHRSPVSECKTFLKSPVAVSSSRKSVLY